MEKEKQKRTLGQLVLVICAVVCLMAAVLTGFSCFTGMFGAEISEILLSIFWALLVTANLLTACANWKKQKVLSTVQIGLWSFFLGAFVFNILSLLANR